jgi:hypothetical protein
MQKEVSNGKEEKIIKWASLSRIGIYPNSEKTELKYQPYLHISMSLYFRIFFHEYFEYL